MIGSHDADGLLIAGVHVATWREFLDRFGYNARRASILARVRPVIQHLAECGCPAILIGGSFVTTKENPKDIDFAWSVPGTHLENLNPAFGVGEGIDALRAHFGADIFPSTSTELESGERFGVFFQHTKDGRPKGVVLIYLMDKDGS